MLILTRRVGEILMLGENIKVRVLSAEDGQARIGIAAPLDIAVDRLEVRERRRRMAEGDAVNPSQENPCPAL